MDLEHIAREINQYYESAEDTPLGDGDVFVQCPKGSSRYAPFRALSCTDWCELLKIGYVCESHCLERFTDFQNWFEERYQCPVKGVYLLTIPQDTKVHNAAAMLMKAHQMLMGDCIVFNTKDIPVQIAEWYAKSIFGLVQCSSHCQRGFRFYRRDIAVEVKVAWGEETSVRGVKIEKRALARSEYCIIIYLADSFMIQDICIMDAKFILKKWENKGEFVFLREEQISKYFFSRSSLHKKAVQNVSRLLQFSTPTFAKRMAEVFSIKNPTQLRPKEPPEPLVASV